MKKADGTIHPMWLLVYLPFVASRYFNLLVVRLVTHEPPATDLGGALLLGGRLFPWDRKVLDEGRVSAVLDVCAELPRDLSMGKGLPHYLAVPVLDSSGPTVRQLAHGVEWALSHLQAGEGVLVQCTLGHGRSAIFAAALLLTTGRATTIEEAIRIMRSSRPRIGLNRRQKASLEKALGAGVLPSLDPASRPAPRQSL